CALDRLVVSHGCGAKLRRRSACDGPLCLPGSGLDIRGLVCNRLNTNQSAIDSGPARLYKYSLRCIIILSPSGALQATPDANSSTFSITTLTSGSPDDLPRRPIRRQAWRRSARLG